MVKGSWNLSTPAQQRPRFTVIAALFCALLEIIWLSQTIFTWKTSPQEDQWPCLRHKSGFSGTKKKFLTNFLSWIWAKHVFGGTRWKLTHPPKRHFHFSYHAAHQVLNRATAKRCLCSEEPFTPRERVQVPALPTSVELTPWPWARGDGFPVTGKLKSKLLIQGVSIQKHEEVHLFLGWKSYFIFISKEGHIIHWMKRRKKTSSGQGHSVTDLDAA